jgi:hypothetical protein
MHEASLYEQNCFLTLTYKDECLPPGGSLRYEDFQGFLKRLRGRFAPRMIRYFVCGEYGEALGRPHYHAALFNFAFADAYVWRNFGSGSVASRSPALELLWPFGSSSIGTLNRDSAGYIARYIHKKVTGDQGVSHYENVDVGSGEVFHREPEFVRMSLRPGLGYYWFRLYGGTDVYPHDRVVVDGTPQAPPRFYEKLMERCAPGLIEQLKLERVARARSRFADNTPERLAVKEVVAKARLSLKRRRLK